MIVAALAFGVVEIVAGLMPTYVAFASVTPVIGPRLADHDHPANATIQLSVAPEMRGRVMALYMMIFMGGTPIGAPIVGWVGETFGARWTLIGGGVATILGTLLAVLVFSRAQGPDRARARRGRPTGRAARRASEVGAAGEVVAGRA